MSEGLGLGRSSVWTMLGSQTVRQSVGRVQEVSGKNRARAGRKEVEEHSFVLVLLFRSVDLPDLLQSPECFYSARGRSSGSAASRGTVCSGRE